MIVLEGNIIINEKSILHITLKTIDGVNGDVDTNDDGVNGSEE